MMIPAPQDRARSNQQGQTGISDVTHSISGAGPAFLRGIALACAVASGLASVACAGEATHRPRPQRIVSINMCADELLLRLADPAQIASVTWLSQDDRNANLAPVARRFPANHGVAEEVLAFRPDLVLAGPFSAPASVQNLRRVGVKVAEFDVPNSLDEVRRHIRDIAHAIGAEARGEAMVGEMDAQFSALAARAHVPRLQTIVLRPNGYTFGRGSLVDEILDRAGLENMAPRIGFAHDLQIPLEAVALQKAEVLILDGDSDGPPSLATQALHHPVVDALGARLRIVSMPSRLWSCAGPALVDAVSVLIASTSDTGQRP